MNVPRIVLLLAALAALLSGCRDREAPPRAGLSVAEALSEGAEGHARALEPRSFRFPEDHGPHPRFRTEWWYLTGNLAAEDGRRFGTQLTFFRNALAPPPDSSARPAPAQRPSDWATRQTWFAHFALTDVAAGRFVSAERLVRGAVGLAGAEVAPDGAGLDLWVADWTARTVPDGPAPGPAAAGLLPLRLRAADGAPDAGIAIDLVLRPGKPPVAHGEDGLSRKGGGPGNASYYYSFTRLTAEGTVVTGGERVAVTGRVWMDREWSTSALTAEQEGWDWFSLQLDDGRDLMVYALRLGSDDSGGQSGELERVLDPASSGTLVEPDGTARHLELSDVEIEPLERWESPRSGAVYPVRWRLRVPDAGIDLVITTPVEDQELDVGFRYWEGTVTAEGTSADRPVSGRGYVELTGYGASPGATPARRSTY